MCGHSTEHVGAQHCCDPACPGVEIISIWFFLGSPETPETLSLCPYGTRCAAQPPPGARCTFNFVDLFTVVFFIL
jgi:hypothetical protein